ncbi:8982_t:CDS:2 [Entrophospora sp. SA101]|nr:8982_t:CDS:2 [Entrophospora sp. SA101]
MSISTEVLPHIYLLFYLKKVDKKDSDYNTNGRDQRRLVKAVIKVPKSTAYQLSKAT